MSTPPAPKQPQDGSSHPDSPPVIAKDTPRPLRWVTPRLTQASSSNQETETGSTDQVQPELHFVGETGVARPTGVFRDVIRSQARSSRPSSNRRRGSEPKIRRLHDLRSKADSASDWEAEASNMLMQESTQDQSPRNTFASPGSSAKSNALEPFESLPMPSDIANTRFLLHHYRYVFLQSQTSAAFREEIFRYAISDPALLHSVLAHSALHFSRVSLSSSMTDVLYHRGQAINLLNARMADPNLQPALDTTICAIACMIHLEIANGTMNNVKIHSRGLGALVKSRGGIHVLADYPLAMSFIIWTDIIASLIMDTEPCLELDQPSPSQLHREPATLSPIAFRYQTKLSNFTAQPDLSQETVEIYQWIRHFTAMKDRLSAWHNRSELQQLLDMSVRLDRRLIKLIRSEVLNPPDQTTIIYRLFGNAALVHQVMFIRQIPTRLSLSNILSDRLQILLECIDLAVLQVQYPDMMLWILMLGGIGGVGTPNQGWFAERLADACCAAGVRVRNEIAATLSDFLWTDQYLGPVSVGFWNDVIVAQAAKGWG